MPNTKIDPKISKHWFTTEKEESCVAHIGIKVPPSIKKALKDKPGWQDDVRDFLAKYIENCSESA